MLQDYFWYYVIGAAIILIIWRIRASARRNNYVYNFHETYQTGHVASFDSGTGQQSMTDFRFFERRFMTSIDRILARVQTAANSDQVEEAERLAHQALAEVDQNLGRDHWYAVHALGWLGNLRYRQGYMVEAREYWEMALEVASEWPIKLAHDVHQIKEDLARCTDQLGF